LLEQRKAIDDSLVRALNALPLLLSGEMEKAMAQVHTSKPPRPKPPRPVKPPEADASAPE
jgi:PTH1 family peptidyl-tRNA hydrolase